MKRKSGFSKVILWLCLIFLFLLAAPSMLPIFLIITGGLWIGGALNDGKRQQKLLASTATPQQPPLPPVQPKLSSAQVTEQSRFMQEANQYLSRMRRYSQSIKNPNIAGPLATICSTMETTLRVVRAHPEKRKQTELFLRSYVPALNKVIMQYEDIEKNGLEVQMGEFRLKLEKFLQDAQEAFDNHLESLFSSEVMDASAEIDMMKTMLKADGLLGDDDFFSTPTPSADSDSTPPQP